MAEADADTPDTALVFRDLLRKHRGKALLTKARDLLPPGYHGDAAAWFRRHPQKFVVFTDDDGIPHYVSVRHQHVTLCRDYFHQACTSPTCRKLHVCRNCVAGHCEEGLDCDKGVNFKSEHNLKILRGLKLSKFSKDEVENLLICSTLQVCGVYNSPDGCRHADRCIRLHLCRDYVQNQCYEREDCDKRHLVDDPHAQRLLAAYNLADVLREKGMNELKSELLIMRRIPVDALSRGLRSRGRGWPLALPRRPVPISAIESDDEEMDEGGRLAHFLEHMAGRPRARPALKTGDAEREDRELELALEMSRAEMRAQEAARREQEESGPEEVESGQEEDQEERQEEREVADLGDTGEDDDVTLAIAHIPVDDVSAMTPEEQLQYAMTLSAQEAVMEAARRRDDVTDHDVIRPDDPGEAEVDGRPPSPARRHPFFRTRRPPSPARRPLQVQPTLDELLDLTTLRGESSDEDVELLVALAESREMAERHLAETTAHPPAKGTAHPPGKGTAHPPGKGTAHPPTKGTAHPPAGDDTPVSDDPTLDEGTAREALGEGDAREEPPAAPPLTWRGRRVGGVHLHPGDEHRAICEANLRGGCGYRGEQVCPSHHWGRPYHWQVRLPGEGSGEGDGDSAGPGEGEPARWLSVEEDGEGEPARWLSVEEDDLLEEEYCEPLVDAINAEVLVGGRRDRLTVHFTHPLSASLAPASGEGGQDAEGLRVPVRRLGTPPAVGATVKRRQPGPLLTRWSWWWEVDAEWTQLPQDVQDRLEVAFYRLEDERVEVAVGSLPAQPGTRMESRELAEIGPAAVNFADMSLRLENTGERYHVTRRPQPQE